MTERQVLKENHHHGPSSHLSWAELACKDGTPYPAHWRATRAPLLGAEFERIRAVVGQPLTIGSAYRSPSHNRKVGGARKSQHVEGRALDLYPPAGWTIERFYRVIREVAAQPESLIYGVGRYPRFVHIDIRPAPAHGHLIAWDGARAWAEVKDGKKVV